MNNNYGEGVNDQKSTRESKQFDCNQFNPQTNNKFFFNLLSIIIIILIKDIINNNQILKDQITNFNIKTHMDKNSIKSPMINFKDFIICDCLQELNNIRNLEENENIKLEIDEKYIESNPSYLRSGNVYNIPLIFIIVKDGNGNLIPDLNDKSIYNINFLNSLVNVTHSKNSKFIKRITIDRSEEHTSELQSR